MKILPNLLPLFLLCFFIFSGYAGAKEVEWASLYGSQYYTGGSIIVFTIEDSGIFNIGDIKAEYKLKDPSGKIVMIWEHEPDIVLYGNGWYAKDTFEIKLPCMYFYKEGIWRVEGRFKASVTDFDATVYYTNINVIRGSFFDEIFAPIYIYATWNFLIFKIYDVKFIFPAIGLLLTPIIVILIIIFLIKYWESAGIVMKRIIKKK